MNPRKIPATMVTQHPDNASQPYWHHKIYLSTQYEAEEAYRSYSELGASEYKWDWEGKFVDESVVERLYGEHLEFFLKNPLGEEKFLTFRLPNPRIETEFRLARAFINMAIAAAVAKHFKFRVPPLFEVILPMTENARELIDLQEAFVEIHALKHPLYKLDGFLTNLRIIPLFEKVKTIINSDKILEEYLQLHKKRFDRNPPYMRPYMARSDPALNSGMIPTVLAIKIALSRYAVLSKKSGIPLYPAIGAGSLPFRGGLTPETVADFLQEYKGIRTTTIQSAFRYDYPLEDVKKGIAYLEKNISRDDALYINSSEEKNLVTLIETAEKYYQTVIEPIAETINKVAAFIPKRRERFLHVGLFGYSRGEAKVKLPRAITFTASLYSLGVPPEFFGTGRAIAHATKTGQLKLLEKYYINMKKDLFKAGKYLNKNNLAKLAKINPAWKYVQEDVKAAEEYLGSTFQPQDSSEKTHGILTTKIFAGLNVSGDITKYIEQAALIRKSLG